MVIARQGSADLGNNGGVAGSWNSPAYTVNASSNCVVLSVAGANPSSGSGNSITGATYGGVAMTQAPSAPGFAGTFPASARCQNLFYLFNPPTGSNVFVVSQASSGFSDSYILALAADYSGVDTSGLDSTAVEHDSGGAAVSSLSAPVTVNTIGAWIVSTIGGNTLNTCTNTALSRVVDGAAFTFPFLFDSNAGIGATGTFANTYNFSASGEPGIAAGAVVLALKPLATQITLAAQHWAWDGIGLNLSADLSLAAQRWAWGTAGLALGNSLVLVGQNWAWKNQPLELIAQQLLLGERWEWEGQGLVLNPALTLAAQRWAWNTSGLVIPTPRMIWGPATPLLPYQGLGSGPPPFMFHRKKVPQFGVPVLAASIGAMLALYYLGRK